jgi:hypothetical protein
LSKSVLEEKKMPRDMTYSSPDPITIDSMMLRMPALALAHISLIDPEKESGDEIQMSSSGYIRVEDIDGLPGDGFVYNSMLAAEALGLTPDDVWSGVDLSGLNGSDDIDVAEDRRVLSELESLVGWRVAKFDDSLVRVWAGLTEKGRKFVREEFRFPDEVSTKEVIDSIKLVASLEAHGTSLLTYDTYDQAKYGLITDHISPEYNEEETILLGGSLEPIRRPRVLIYYPGMSKFDTGEYEDSRRRREVNRAKESNARRSRRCNARDTIRRGAPLAPPRGLHHRGLARGLRSARGSAPSGTAGDTSSVVEERVLPLA